MKTDSNLALKAIAAACFTALTVSIIIVSKSVATGYELSIYSETPILFWILLVVSVTGTIWLVVAQAFRDSETSHLKGAVVGLLGLINLTVLSLPMLRGYLLYASHDSLVHIGRGFDISLTGHADAENVYPVIHVLIAQLSQVCGITPISVGRFLPVLLNLVFMVMVAYLVADASLQDHGQRLLAFALASGFLLNSLHVLVYSQTASFFFVLLAVYLRLNESLHQRPAGRMILIIVLLVIPYSHPTPSLMVILFLLAVELGNALVGRRMSTRPISRRISLNLTLISAITFFTWISSFILFDVKVSTLWANLRTPFAAPQVEALENAFGASSIGDIVGVFLKMHGDSVFCLMLALGGALTVTRQRWSGKEGLNGIWVLAVVFLVSIPVQLLIFAGARSQTVGRLVNLNFAIFLAPVLAAYALHQILRRVGKTTARAVSSTLLLAIWLVGVSGIYQSPWISQASWQVTQMDIQGIEWFLKSKDPDILFSAMGFLHGTQYTPNGYRMAFVREDFRESMWQIFNDTAQALPNRFGYNRFRMLGESLDQDRYLIIGGRFQMAMADPSLSSKGLTVLPIFWPGFRLADFAMLKEDPSVEKLYSNGEWDAWLARNRPRAD